MFDTTRETVSKKSSARDGYAKLRVRERVQRKADGELIKLFLNESDFFRARA